MLTLLPACRHQHMRKREVDRMQELKTEMLEAGVKPCKDVSSSCTAPSQPTMP